MYFKVNLRTWIKLKPLCKKIRSFIHQYKKCFCLLFLTAGDPSDPLAPFSWSNKLFLLHYFSAEFPFYMTGRMPQDVSHKTSKINWKSRETQFRWNQLWDKPQQMQNVSIKNTAHFAKPSLFFINSPGEEINFSVAIISPRVKRLWNQGSYLPCFLHCNLYLSWRHTVFTVLFPSLYFKSSM